MTPPRLPHRCPPDDALPPTPPVPRYDDFPAVHCYLCNAAKADWFIESLRLPPTDRWVPFHCTKWADMLLGPLTLTEWHDGLCAGTIREVPTLSADLLACALVNEDAEVRSWAFLALSQEPAVPPDFRRAQYLAHHDLMRPAALPNSPLDDVRALPSARRRSWVSFRVAEGAWPSDE